MTIKRVIFAAIAIIGIVFWLLSTLAYASTLQGFQGGTGISTTTAGNVGNCLQVSSSSPFLLWTTGICGVGSFSATGTPGQVVVFTGTSTGLGFSTLFFSSSTSELRLGTSSAPASVANLYVYPTNAGAPALFEDPNGTGLLLDDPSASGTSFGTGFNVNQGGTLQALFSHANTSSAWITGDKQNDIDIANVSGFGNINLVNGTNLSTAPSIVISTSSITLQKASVVMLGSLTQSGGLASLASTTITGQATTTNLSVTSIGNALVLSASNGLFGAYGGASACGAGNAVTTISATGGTTCAPFGSSNVSTSTANTWTALQTYTGGINSNSSTLAGNISLPSSTASSLLGTDSNKNATSVAVGAYLGLSGGTLTPSSTLASSTWGSFSFPSSTSLVTPMKIISGVTRTISWIGCDDSPSGTSTYHIFKVTAIATNTDAADLTSSTITCGIAGNTTTTFTSSTFGANDYLAVTSTVVGTPTASNLYMRSTKQ